MVERRQVGFHFLRNILIDSRLCLGSILSLVSECSLSGLQPPPRYPQLTSSQCFCHWTLYAGISRYLRQDVHFLWNEHHKFTLMTMDKQIHIISGIIQSLQESDKANLSPTQLHVMHGYENTFLHFFNLSNKGYILFHI